MPIRVRANGRRWVAPIPALFLALLPAVALVPPQAAGDVAGVPPRPLFWEQPLADPSVVLDGSRWFAAGTGWRGGTSSSTQEHAGWAPGPPLLDSRPQWARNGDVWAPELVRGPGRRLAGLLLRPGGRAPRRRGPVHRGRHVTRPRDPVHASPHPAARLPRGRLDRPGQRRRTAGGRAAAARGHRPVVLRRARRTPVPALPHPGHAVLDPDGAADGQRPARGRAEP